MVYREKEICAIIENKYSVPWVHKGGNITYTNYISIGGHEIRSTNDIFYRYNIGENVCVKYTTNKINFHQIVGGLGLFVLFIFILVEMIWFIFIT
jgi:hypothetical protein